VSRHTSGDFGQGGESSKLARLGVAEGLEAGRKQCGAEWDVGCGTKPGEGGIRNGTKALTGSETPDGQASRPMLLGGRVYMNTWDGQVQNEGKRTRMRG
jgi:hypothetical protein